MTTIATRSELAIVFVIRTVTRKTGSGLRVDLIDNRSMAAMAMNFFMSTLKLELRLRIMIKTPDRPTIRIMAVLTIFAQFFLMLIVFFVTAIAF